MGRRAEQGLCLRKVGGTGLGLEERPWGLMGVRRRDSEKTVESMLVASCKSEELQEGAPEGKNWKDNTQWLTNERHDIEKLWTRM